MAHPQRLGKYQITGVLGEGAMGVVYRGFDPDIRRVVALKTVRHQGGLSAQDEAQSAARFRNEAQAAGRLQHPGIVGVYDFGDDGQVAYIAMEYVEGHTLAAYLAQPVRFSDTDVASLTSQLLDALSHAHEHGVWHRDVKPSNVIMTRTGRIKIADFGIARTDTAGLTMTGSVLGTPMYMAPEQFMGRPVDHRVDLYATGVLLYQLVAGRPPFVGPSESLMYKVVHEAPPVPSQVDGTSRSGRFDAIVARALAKQPQDRYAHAAAFREAVTGALGQPAPPSVSPEAVHALPAAWNFAPTERIATSHVVPAPAPLPARAAAPSTAPAAPPTGGTGPAPAHWDPVILAQVEATLARHVGPLAAVLVRRAARDCRDLPTLYARLGEQITQNSVREAFLGQVLPPRTAGSPGTGGRSTLVSVPAPLPAPVAGGSASGPQVSDALLEQAHKLLAQHLGPIARVVVRRAAERTRQREPLLALLVEAVPEAARERVALALSRLP